jgi:hypothetical protein
MAEFLLGSDQEDAGNLFVAFFTGFLCEKCVA